MIQKFLAPAALFVFLFGVGIPTHAQQFILPDPGLTPESPVYFLDIWEERLRLFFTRSDRKRLERYTANVSERLAEADKLAGRGISATQKALDQYRADMPFLYAAALRLGDKAPLSDALTLASDHMQALDHISERTDADKKRFILFTKIFLINQQLQTLSSFAKRYPDEALMIFADALGRRMNRVREVAIDHENNEEALEEYSAYLSETQKILHEWRADSNDGVSPALYLEGAVRGHEETLLGGVYERLTPVMDEKLLLAVNQVRALSGRALLKNLPPRPLVRGGTEDPVTNGACTQEAKICPDGSAVGRTGPTCEFAPCPSSSAPEPTPDSTAPPPSPPSGS